MGRPHTNISYQLSTFVLKHDTHNSYLGLRRCGLTCLTASTARKKVIVSSCLSSRAVSRVNGKGTLDPRVETIHLPCHHCTPVHHYIAVGNADNKSNVYTCMYIHTFTCTFIIYSICTCTCTQLPAIQSTLLALLCFDFNLAS